jgi:hypothetical protein
VPECELLVRQRASQPCSAAVLVGADLFDRLHLLCIQIVLITQGIFLFDIFIVVKHPIRPFLTSLLSPT